MKAMDLFEAYKQDKLPKDEGYIVSSFFSEQSTYSMYEIISYSGVKAIFAGEDSITFQSNGKKVHVLVEPASYPTKSIEPYCRSSAEQIPLRFKELNILTAKNQSRVMSSKKPIDSLSSFTITKPSGINFCFVFYMRPDVFDSLQLLMEKTLNKEGLVPHSDAKKAAEIVVETVKKEMTWDKDRE